MSQTVSVPVEWLTKLLDYCEPDEAKHFEECVDSEDYSNEHLHEHIYTTIRSLRQVVDNT